MKRFLSAISKLLYGTFCLVIGLVAAVCYIPVAIVKAIFSSPNSGKKGNKIEQHQKVASSEWINEMEELDALLDD